MIFYLFIVPYHAEYLRSYRLTQFWANLAPKSPTLQLTPMCINLYKEFLCQYEFQLSLSFSRQNKELEKKVYEIRVFLFYLEHLCSNYVVLDPINI